MSASETSTSFDLEDIGLFLRCLAEDAGGLSIDPQWVLEATERIEELDLGAELRLELDVQDTSIEVRAVATDNEVVDLYFSGPRSLCEQIEATMDRFFEERGM